MEQERPLSRPQTYSIRDTALVDGTRVNYTIEYPYRANYEQEFLAPIVFVPGNFEPEEALHVPRRSLAEISQRPVATFDQPRMLSFFNNFYLKHVLHPENSLKEASIGVVDDIYEKYGHSRVHLLGHSMGGPAAVSTALERPNHIESVTLMASAGIENLTPIDMSSRMPGYLGQEACEFITKVQDWEKIGSIALAVAMYGCINPWRTISESMAVTTSDIKNHVRRLAQLNIPVSILQFQNDKLIDTKRTRQAAASLPNAWYLEYPDPNAGHNEFLKQPRKVARTLIDLIAKMTPIELEAA